MDHLEKNDVPFNQILMKKSLAPFIANKSNIQGINDTFS